jgi:hypothetical protein
LEEVPENDGFVEDDEDNEVDIDDEFEEIEEEKLFNSNLVMYDRTSESY